MFQRRHARRIVKLLRKEPSFSSAHERGLISAGRDAIPVYLAALDECDPSEPTSHGYRNPYETLVRVLVALRADELIDRALKDFPRARRPEELGYAVAVMGHDDSIDPCIQWLTSTNDDVRHRTQEGIAKAARGSTSARFRRSMFDAVASLVSGREEMSQPWATFPTLLALDQTAAIELLRTGEHLRLDNPNLSALLECFARGGVAIDAALLQEFSRFAAATAPQHAPDTPVRRRWERLHRACLTILSDTAPELIRNELESALESEDETLRQLAVELIIKIEGLIPMYRNFTPEQYNSWPREQQLVADLVYLRLNVQNGGLGSIWVNLGPLQYRTFVPQLREIGANSTAETLLSVARLLGVDDPALEVWPDDRGLPFDDEVDRRIDELRAATPEFDWLEVLLLRYMREHRDLFVASGEPGS